MESLLVAYKNKYSLELKKELKCKNIFEVPKLGKIAINMSTKLLVTDRKMVDIVCEQLALISGQKPVITYAKNSISTFKLREGQPIGAKVTLRGKRMFQFYEKFLEFVVPRIRDFQGFQKRGFDGFGNYNLGIKEQISFLEIDYEKYNKILGLNVSLITSAKNNHAGYLLLKKMEFPFREQ